ncbi:MAG: 3-phosphoshikimate 1-carboxyvinyltransferase [Lutibacter sp.]|uniref:3-phosphoshikimate 1-carboxyvinyltransferase n=1 Tax=Lutibacter sp. TaxID=1925666 RepID=UPI00299E29D8|nr:3-phosphoshikimate 1-carboxyvinyltransferase [Lutibacter sp.]MDX1829381.1 3-phosphoshikimate 1-carboxyvinyltransferase [Lutibacter sp.]
MELLKINKVNKIENKKIQITGSKSETNRLLILQQLYDNLKIENPSVSDDSLVLQKALVSSENEINISHAGTAMRFLTAYFATQENREVILTGSDRMKNRPIKILVDALRFLGAEIQYLEKEGYPPLKISGKKLVKDFVEIQGDVSSQYISALLLIAPKLPNGIKLKFKGEVTSVPYIKMTLSLLSNIGIEFDWKDNIITILPQYAIKNKTIVVESDWSSASYFYSLVALSPNSEIQLASYRKNSLQGDADLFNIYKKLGVQTIFKENTIILKNANTLIPKNLELDLINTPDLAQTVAVTCFGLGISCKLTGLHTLKIKETDRLVALKTEIEKLGGKVNITDNSIQVFSSAVINKNISIATYHDHRMAMAFAPLALKGPIQIEDPEVVSKSYPNFWNDFEKITQ